MAIPASHIVEINPRVITAGSGDLVFNGLFLTENSLISATTMVLSFANITDVGAYFGIDSPEYAVAEVYFTSYDNKFSAPQAILFARRVNADVPAWIRGARVNSTLAQLKAVTDGAMVMTIDSTSISVSGVDFSAAESYSQAGEILATALAAQLSGVTVTYSSLNGSYTIQSPTAGESSTIDYAAPGASGTDLSNLLNLTQSAGAVLSQGRAAMTTAEQMAAIKTATQNFATLTTLWEAEADEMLEYATWASANYGWLYVAYTTNPAVLSQDTAADPASVLKNSGYENTAIVYGAMEYAAFIMGVAASIPWGRTNGTITFAFKAQSGLAPLVVDETSAAVLESKNCNYFGNFATRNAEFIFMYPGCLSASDYVFIDSYINSVWLNSRLQVALMDGLKETGRVPYNDTGYTLIRAWMMDPVNEARNNGTIEAGVTLNERQKSELINEAGLDISPTLWTQGYFIQILDPGAAVRGRRGSPVISLWYTYAGAVHRIEVASTAVL